jgi:hypothetical protein
MKLKTIVILLLLAGVAIVPVMADSQVDIGVQVPTIIGLYYQGENVTQDIPVRIPFPDLMYNYFFEVGPLKLGVGARVWTLLVATAAYPIVSAEFQTERLILNANIGGGVFGYVTIFPEWSGIETGQVFFPEVSAAFRLNDWFSLGVSALGIWLPEITNEGMGFTINVLARFRVK